MLMFPCIFLSTICSAFSVFSQNSPRGYLFVSGINAIISFLLAIVNYLKLDAAAEAHHISSNHFSRMKTLLEFNSGETLLFEHPLLQTNGVSNEIDNWNKMHIDGRESERQEFIEELYRQKHKLEEELVLKIQEKIKMVREKVLEIKENNSFTIPKKIIDTYPIIYSINIFSFIKIVDDYRMRNTNTLKNVINEIKYMIGKDNVLNDTDKLRIKYLYEHKNYILEELIMVSSSFYMIDIIFQQEIKNNVLYHQYYYRFLLKNILDCFCCLKGVIQLPPAYKDPYESGYCDKKTGQPLLRKILNI